MTNPRQVGTDEAPVAAIKEFKDYAGNHLCTLSVLFSDGTGWMLPGRGQSIEKARQSLADWLRSFNGEKGP